MFELVALDITVAVVFACVWDNAQSISDQMFVNPWFGFLLTALVLSHMVHIVFWSGDWTYEAPAAVGAIGWTVLLLFDCKAHLTTHYLGVTVFGIGVTLLGARTLSSPAELWSCLGACAFALLEFATAALTVAFVVLYWVDRHGPLIWAVERAAFLGVIGELAIVSVMATTTMVCDRRASLEWFPGTGSGGPRVYV